MNLGLSDRVVLVTGASKGIGYACAVAFAAEGARVAIASRSRANLDAALARWPLTAKPLAFVADLVRADEAQRLVDSVEVELGPIDVLVNSAGAARRTLPDELDATAWHAAMDAKFFSYIHPPDIVVKRMAARGRGGILLMSSLAGGQGCPMVVSYAASKAFEIVLAEGLWDELRPAGVDVLACRAGPTRTPSYEASHPRKKVPIMEPMPVVEEALAALGRRPVVVAGRLNRAVGFVMQRLLTRAAAVRFMGRHTRQMYE